MNQRIVLVTGSAGRLGRAAVRELKRSGWFVRGFDLPSPTDEARAASTGDDDREAHLPHEQFTGDLAQPNAIDQAAEGASAVIHLGAVPDDAHFRSRLAPANIFGLYETMESARRAGVQRLVLASTGQVVWWNRYSGPLPIAVDVEPMPKGWYAATKMFAEAAGKAYAASYSMTVVAARLGWCPRTREQCDQLAATPWGPDVYLSPGDAGRFFVQAVEAPLNPGYYCLYAAGPPVNEVTYDLEPSERLLGFRPLDRYPTGIDEIVAAPINTDV